MKKYLALILCLQWGVAQAQLEEKEKADWQPIGKLKFGGITKASLDYIAHGSDTSYLLLIKDVREQPEKNYFTIRFESVNNTFNKLYTLLKSFFLKENKGKDYTKTFILGTTNVNVQHKGLITGKGIMFTTRDGYTYWDEKDVDKLFGKR
ncbi:MAG: hypothetical protein WDN26_12530 [Chitinophagaceae bacterium]